jgi:hypothetical protein
MKASAVWRLAARARERLLAHPRRPKLDLARLITRCRKLRINGVVLDVVWDWQEPVTDRDGRPVLGATEYDDSCPGTALIYLNTGLLCDAEDLARSTAAHELGHAIFDVPSWTVRGSRERSSAAVEPTRRAALASVGANARPTPPIDWGEWRANEFMGAFLVPAGLLHAAVVSRAIDLRIPLVEPEGHDRPIVDRRRAGPDRLDALLFEVADAFGLSVSFIEQRVRKYGLLHDAVERPRHATAA